jgi:pimeloyl-ACP methyl ester carboxylesterase
MMGQSTLNDYNFFYKEKGSGEYIVFVHGSASDYRTWDKQLKVLGKFYHTIAYSRRFHFPNEQIGDQDDYSMKQHVEDLEAFIHHLDQNAVHLVGHSYGGFICLLLAMKNPSIIRTLVLAEPPVMTLYVRNMSKPFELLKLLVTKPRLGFAIMKFGIKGVAPAINEFKKDETDRALDYIGKAILGIDTYLALSESRHAQARENLIKAEFLGSGFPPLEKNKIRDLTLPTMLISAKNSRKLFHFLLDGLQDLIPYSERITIPNASHIMHEDNARKYNSAIHSFLKRY